MNSDRSFFSGVSQKAHSESRICDIRSRRALISSSKTLAYSSAGPGVAGPAALLQASLKDRLIFLSEAIRPDRILIISAGFIDGFHEQHA
jgi:hypothetical protein